MGLGGDKYIYPCICITAYSCWAVCSLGPTVLEAEGSTLIGKGSLSPHSEAKVSGATAAPSPPRTSCAAQCPIQRHRAPWGAPPARGTPWGDIPIALRVRGPPAPRHTPELSCPAARPRVGPQQLPAMGPSWRGESHRLERSGAGTRFPLKTPSELGHAEPKPNCSLLCFFPR